MASNQASSSHIRVDSRLKSYIDDSVFPCSAEELLWHAEHNMAPDSILDAIEDLPRKSYASLRELIPLLMESEQMLAHARERV